VAFLCSRCQAYSLPPSGNKPALVKRLFEHFHPSDTAQPPAPIDRNTPNVRNQPSTSQIQQRVDSEATSESNSSQQTEHTEQ